MLKVPMKYESVTIPWKISFPVTCSTEIIILLGGFPIKKNYFSHLDMLW